jgi:hypothetical protein
LGEALTLRYQEGRLKRWQKRWDGVLRKRVFWGRFGQVLARSSEEVSEAETDRCPLAYYSALRSAILWAYFKPYRKHFWNVKEYSEYGPLGPCQHGGPVRYIAVTPALTLFYLWLWRQLPSPEIQQWLKKWRRYYKIDCWSNYRFDDRSSAYLQVNEIWERTDTRYRRFDQRAHAYLHIEHVPKPGWKWGGGKVICLPPRDYAKLEAAQEPYNAEQHGSYWNSCSLNYRGRVDSIHGGYKSHERKALLSQRLREQRTLNIRAVEVRNNMVEKLESDFASDDGKVV